MAAKNIGIDGIVEVREGALQTGNILFNYDDFASNSNGKPISKKVAQEFVKTKKWSHMQPNEEASVIFDARSLLLLLSQKDCIGIRFYYAKNEKNEETLVLVGIREGEHDLGVQDPGNGKKGSIILDNTLNKNNSIIIEVGGGNDVGDFG